MAAAALSHLLCFVKLEFNPFSIWTTSPQVYPPFVEFQCKNKHGTAQPNIWPSSGWWGGVFLHASTNSKHRGRQTERQADRTLKEKDSVCVPFSLQTQTQKDAHSKAKLKTCHAMGRVRLSLFVCIHIWGILGPKCHLSFPRGLWTKWLWLPMTSSRKVFLGFISQWLINGRAGSQNITWPDSNIENRCRF